MKSLLAGALALAFVGVCPLRAQSTPETQSTPPAAGTAAAPAPAPEPWEQTNVVFGLNAYSGSTDSASLSFQANSTVQKERLELELISNANFSKAEQQELVDTQDADVSLRWLLRDKSKWFALGHGWFEHDEISGIVYRATAGPGIGVHLIDDPKFRLTLEGGVGMTTENTSHHDNDYVSFFFDPSFKWTISERASMQQKLDTRLNAEDGGDVRLRFESDVTVQLTQRLGIQQSVQIDYDTEPVPGKAKTNIQTSLGLSISIVKSK